MITVGKLFELLAGTPKDAVVLLSSDAESNDLRPLQGTYPAGIVRKRSGFEVIDEEDIQTAKGLGQPVKEAVVLVPID